MSYLLYLLYYTIILTYSKGHPSVDPASNVKWQQNFQSSVAAFLRQAAQCAVRWLGKFVHSLGWGNYGHSNTLWTALSTTHQPLQLNFSKLKHQLHNGSFHRKQQTRVIVTSSVWGKPVLLWEPCYSLGNKTIAWVVRKVRTEILLADLVCFEVQCLNSLSILISHINRKLMNRYASLIFSKKQTFTQSEK